MISARVGEFSLYEPASLTEYGILLDNLHPDEAGELVAAGASLDDAFAAFRKMRRCVSVYHRGVLMGIGEMMDRPDGSRFISLERTRYCLAKGHRFAWLKTFKYLVKWFIDTDNWKGHKGDFYTATPTDLPRALDLYGPYAGAEVVGTRNFNGRDYWMLKINGGS